MDQTLMILGIAVFSASALQAATGIGFGIIAGPILLMALNDAAAIQVSVILNLLIALLLAPSLYKYADRDLLLKLLAGVAIGTPLGLFVYLRLDVSILKILAGLVVLFTLYLVLSGRRREADSHSASTSSVENISVGIVAGMMGGSLAMPGPVPAAWMASKGFDKNTIRATILLMFVFAYGVALGLQISFAGISGNSLRLCMNLALPTVSGILLGKFLAARISEKVFRGLLIMILAATVILLGSSLIQ